LAKHGLDLKDHTLKNWEAALLPRHQAEVDRWAGRPKGTRANKLNAVVLETVTGLLTRTPVLKAVDNFARPGRKRWVFLVISRGLGISKGKRREMGLGGFPETSLADARAKAAKARALVKA
jgi:hypothetical protein